MCTLRDGIQVEVEKMCTHSRGLIRWNTGMRVQGLEGQGDVSDRPSHEVMIFWVIDIPQVSLSLTQYEKNVCNIHQSVGYYTLTCICMCYIQQYWWLNPLSCFWPSLNHWLQCASDSRKKSSLQLILPLTDGHSCLQPRYLMLLFSLILVNV